MAINLSRRKFLFLSLLAAFVAAGGSYFLKKLDFFFSFFQSAEAATQSEVFLSKNGTPEENMARTITMMGGIASIISPSDIVVLKPNAQWWNQGRTNLAAMKKFIEIVLAMPGFSGEIIIAENHHFMDTSLPRESQEDIRGWSITGEINNEIDGVKTDLNGLVKLFNSRGHRNVTKYQWRDGGARREGTWGNGENGGVVKGPWEGDGYVWSDMDYEFSPLLGLKKWKVKMTYPVFTSRYSGVTIDLKKGAFKRDGAGGGKYLDEVKVKLINFSALNTHGTDTGTTGAVKNYMGITDLSCGAPGIDPKGYYNVHYCGGKHFRYAKAGPIAHFMKTVRKADLNIVTAEWVGWGHRIDTSKAARTRTILVGVDPIALDYYGAKHLIYPLSRQAEYHDPDRPGSSVRKFLGLARDVLGEGALDDKNLKVHGHDFKRSSAGHGVGA